MKLTENTKNGTTQVTSEILQEITNLAPIHQIQVDSDIKLCGGVESFGYFGFL